ncbi:hypothetical protein F5J12DRAFT_899406 [Pisolithus orientalis]|uniref:uncharacterized protein n=1 Tax=Pisolithus orientalis TaxID=936130 RepID=UPI00222403AD|nr:uncharacterized protein F5J12DRAFT_899406 [Pisolithus orientalis]KAI5984120.1 hypothetical protein F5J12DRAFT_899406 [Pisolithus orientalis]
MASSQFQASTIQPIYPVKMFPVSFRLVKDSSAIPHAGGMRERQGTIYLAPNDMYIFGRSGWVRWDPKDTLHLTVAGDECMIAPCPINGIRLLANDTSYPHYLTSMEVEFRRIGFQHPPTNADILWLMGMQFSNPKSKSQDLEKQGEGVIGRAQKPPAEDAVPMQEAAEDAKPIAEWVPFLDQITCPPDTKVIDWESLDIRTYAPWFSKVDCDAVEYMSKAVSATEYQYGHGWTMLVELKYDGDKGSLAQLIDNISDSLSRGCAVLVRGWKLNNPPLDFTCEDIRFFHLTISQEVVVQDALKHAEQQEAKGGPDMSKVFEVLSRVKFIELADDENTCMNLLDFPNTQPEVPIFLRQLSDNVNAKTMTMNDVYLPHSGKNAGKSYYGVQVVLGDVKRLRGWDLLTHGGFVTYPHHDAAGLCTYITVQSGSKIWGYFDTPGSQDARRENLFKAWDDIFADNVNLKFHKYPLRTIHLQRGDTLIQPPRANHMVYTPQNGLTSGGHFLSYSTMHLTEIAINYDCSKVPEGKQTMRGLAGTNAVHPAIHRIIVWMVLALPMMAKDRTRTFYHRPLLAMISLIESKKGKYKSAEDADHMPAMDERDNMRKEIANESEAAKKIILHLKKALQVMDAEKELETGSWWDRGPVCELFNIFEKYKSA